MMVLLTLTMLMVVMKMSNLNTTIFDKVPPECWQKDVIDDINDAHAGDVDVQREHDHPQPGSLDLVPREEEEISGRAQLTLPRLISGQSSVSSSCKSRTLNI